MIDVLERFDKLATDAGTIVVQGLGFLGGLADLLATAAMRDCAVQMFLRPPLSARTARASPRRQATAPR
jgi:hypothetical protein